MSVLLDHWLDFVVHHYVSVGLAGIVFGVVLNMAVMRGPEVIVSLRHLRH